MLITAYCIVADFFSLCCFVDVNVFVFFKKAQNIFRILFSSICKKRKNKELKKATGKIYYLLEYQLIIFITIHLQYFQFVNT